jgi:hypothetical protein
MVEKLINVKIPANSSDHFLHIVERGNCLLGYVKKPEVVTNIKYFWLLLLFYLQQESINKSCLQLFVILVM